MIHRGIEGIDGRMDRNLKADKDSHSEGDPDHREDCPHFIEAEVSEGNVLEEMKKSHDGTRI